LKYGSAGIPPALRSGRAPSQPTGKEGQIISQKFPATGHRYLVDFQAFLVELFFESETSLTYTGVRPDGSRGNSETVSITIEPIRDRLFLVTWQESDKTTVVHLEDYKMNTIITNITDPGGVFAKYHGRMTLIT
jgi:hypothetical protein